MTQKFVSIGPLKHHILDIMKSLKMIILLKWDNILFLFEEIDLRNDM